MSASVLDKKQQKILEEIPSIHDFSKFYFYLSESKMDHEFLVILNQLTGQTDTVLSDWLNISAKTLRNYKCKTDLNLKENTKEHILSLIALYKHGMEVFENSENFENWLKAKNLLLGGKAPIGFLDTISGIKWVDNRLTAMEYGENV
ncbi:antitoxin Xre/MbcA/ParS toxin-binding domain-containing protein [Aquiflexum sp.]|uniref:antitoxin Xre/MbcA/ParS toxin-binding domain-containing protein n=1 Tax=Aquiflexum sp. TaxID=1872584 RepID=UPI00359442A0